jgi:hypothetical protein
MRMHPVFFGGHERCGYSPTALSRASSIHTEHDLPFAAANHRRGLFRYGTAKTQVPGTHVNPEIYRDV